MALMFEKNSKKMMPTDNIETGEIAQVQKVWDEIKSKIFQHNEASATWKVIKNQVFGQVIFLLNNLDTQWRLRSIVLFFKFKLQSKFFHQNNYVRK